MNNYYALSHLIFQLTNVRAFWRPPSVKNENLMKMDDFGLICKGIRIKKRRFIVFIKRLLSFTA